MQRILLIAIAGAAGTLSRYWVSGLMHRWLGANFAYGTLTVNVAGSLLFGFVWTMAEERSLIPLVARTIILVGFMGAFTTFSTFAFETVNYLRDGQYLYAFANIASNCLLGFAALIVGVWGARAL